VVSDDDKMQSYYYKGKKLYKVPQRRPKRTDKPMRERTATSH
jgi:hypothetical protein